MEGLLKWFAEAIATKPLLFLALGFSLCLLILRSVTKKAKVPQSLPWMGRPTSGLFREVRASLSSFSNYREWLAEGYAKVENLIARGQMPVLIKDTVLSGRQVICLPGL